MYKRDSPIGLVECIYICWTSHYANIPRIRKSNRSPIVTAILVSIIIVMKQSNNPTISTDGNWLFKKVYWNPKGTLKMLNVFLSTMKQFLIQTSLLQYFLIFTDLISLDSQTTKAWAPVLMRPSSSLFPNSFLDFKLEVKPMVMMMIVTVKKW